MVGYSSFSQDGTVPVMTWPTNLGTWIANTPPGLNSSVASARSLTVVVFFSSLLTDNFVVAWKAKVLPSALVAKVPE